MGTVMSEWTDADKAAWILENGEPNYRALALMYAARHGGYNILKGVMDLPPPPMGPIPPWVTGDQLLDEITKLKRDGE